MFVTLCTILQFWVKEQVALAWPPQIHRVARLKEKRDRMRRVPMAGGESEATKETAEETE